MPEQYAGFDLIGDVHGCADALTALLDELGYVRRGGYFQYRDQRRPRQAIFLGDIIDRGPNIRESVLCVQDMVSHGHARMILGNHEFHALAYSTPAPPGSEREYLRPHTERNAKLLKQTLEQFANHSGDWRDALAWFAELPLWLERETFRVVHACWDDQLIGEYWQRYGSDRLTSPALADCVDYHSLAHRCIDRLTRGIDLKLPEGVSITSADGAVRRYFRVKFWLNDPQTYGDVEFQPDPLPDGLATQPLPGHQREALLLYGPEQVPLFVGHYWQQGRPHRLAANLACLDYSAVRGGRLVAYRFDNEAQLNDDHFVWVDGLRR